jgi:transcriptional regulator GlxA family with amidase domain
MSKPFEVAMLFYDYMTALDAIGPYEVFRLMPNTVIRTVSSRPGLIRVDAGYQLLNAEHSLDDVPAPDLIFVPGSGHIAPLLENAAVLEWLRQAHTTSKWTVSVCTGAFALGKAGILQGLQATTHWASLEHLPVVGATPVQERMVRQGKVVTAAGVSAGIDLALEIAGLEFGATTAQAIQLGIEYDPHPPFDTGTPSKATPELLAMTRELMRSAPKIEP